MIDFLGWLNVLLIVVMASIYPIKLITMTPKFRKKISPVYKKVRIIHPILGGLIIIIGLSHGTLALGQLRWHTGLFLVLTVAFTGLITIIGPKFKSTKYIWRDIHRASTLLVLMALIIHIFWRGLI